MSTALVLLIAPLAALADLLFGGAISAAGGHPSIAIAVVCAWSVARPLDEAMLLAPTTAIAAGLLGGVSLGVTVLALALPVLLMTRWRSGGGRPSLLLVIALAAATAAVSVIAEAASLAVSERLRPDLFPIVVAMIATVLMTIPLAAMVYWLAMRLSWQPASRGEYRR